MGGAHILDLVAESLLQPLNHRACGFLLLLLGLFLLLVGQLAELEGAQEGLLVLDEALDALSKGLVDEALVDRALDMSARGVEVALTGRAPSRKIVEKADYITEMRCEKHPYEQGICAREGVEY